MLTMLHLRLGSLLPNLVNSLKVRARVWIVQTLCSIPLIELRDKLCELLWCVNTEISLYNLQVLYTCLAMYHRWFVLS